MKRKFKRTLSRVLAGTMIVSSMFTNYVYAEDVTIESDDIVSESAVHVANDANDLEEAEVTYVEKTDAPAYSVEGTVTTYDFTNGSIVPTDTTGSDDIDKGSIRVKVGTENQYGYNGTQHGSVFKKGNTIEIDVTGPGVLEMEGCNYNNDVNVTLTGDNYSDTINVTGTANGGTSECGKMAAFAPYTGGAGTLVLSFDSSTVYLPKITYTAVDPSEPMEGASYTFNFRDESIIPYSAPGNETITSGVVTVKCGTSNAYQPADPGNNHGARFKDGNSIDIKVAGPCVVAISGCNYSNDVTATLSDGAGYESAMSLLGSAREGSCSDGSMYEFLPYKGEAGTLTLSFTNSTAYVDQITVTPYTASEPLAPASKGLIYTVDFTKNTPSEVEGGEPVYEIPAGAYDKQLFCEGLVRANGTGGARADKHGADIKPNDSFELSVAGPANIKILSCAFSSSDGVYTLYDADGNVVDSASALPEENVGADGTEKEIELRYNGEAGEVKVVYTGKGQGYMHYLTVENDFENLGEVQNFEIWYDELADATTKTFAPQTLTYGASTVKLIAQSGQDYAIPNENFKDLEREGKIVNAYKGGERPQTADGAHCNDMTRIPTEGDGNCMVFTPAGRGMFTTWVRAWDGKEARIWRFRNDTGERTGYTSFNTGDKAVEQVSFVAEPGYTYVICTTGQTNNFAFCGSRFIADEELTLPVAQWTTPAESTYNFDNAIIEVYDSYLGEKVAEIDKNTTEISVLAGHKYYLWSLDPGVGADFVSSGTDVDTLTKETTQVQLALREIPDTTLRGEFITSDGTDPDVTELTFTNNISGGVYNAEISADGKSYTCTMKPGDYTTSVKANSFNAVDHARVDVDGSSVNDIFLKALETSEYDLPTEIKNNVSRLQFIKAEAEGSRLQYNNATSISATEGGKIIVPVDGVKKVMVSGWYDGTWDINGQNEISANKDDNPNDSSLAVNEYITNGTETEVTINIKESPTYLRWIKVVDVDDYKWDAENTVLQVPSEKFPTLKDAVTYIKNIPDRPEGEDGRMTIELMDDIEEQIVFDAPYITLKGNGHEISWYYGVGSYFYSIDKATGLYDETLFYDKYNSQEGNGNLWGGVAIVRGDYFLAEDTVFKNNYNYKVTDKYAADLAASAFVLDKTTGEPLEDVGIYSAKERSNAFYIEAKNIELYNCKVLSSQDAFGRNGSANNGYSVYCKDCVIGGNVDYICGEFTAVFDHCELQWKTYTDGNNNNQIGFITAAKTNPYIFRDCEVTADNAKNKPLGRYGRTWGNGSNVSFINTETNGYINEDSWAAMNTNDGAPTFYEYQNTSFGQEFMPVASAAANVTPAVLPDDLVESYTTDKIIDDVLGGWKPVHYDDEYIDRWDGTYGDVWKDGIIDAQDASIAYQIALVSTFGIGNPMIDRRAADVDAEEGITANDATWILQKVLVSTTLFPVEKKTDLPETTLFVVGDSTACDYSPSTDTSYYYKRVGFGTRLGDYFVPEVTVNNLALSGRSSSSFTEEANYQTLIDSMKEGDFLIIAFGHNDEKAGDARYTEPLGDKDTAGSFKNSLYKNYIVPAQEKGVTPILATPIVRRTDSGTWSDSCLHVANGKSYSDCVRELGQELGLTVIDNTNLTKDLYDELKPEGTVDLHAWLSYKPSSVDNTHLNNYGAAYVAYLMADAIKGSDSALAPYVSADIAAPDKAENLIVNPTYVVPDTSDPDPSELSKAVFNQVGKVSAPWFGTIFGDCGGITKYINCDADGNLIEPRTLYEVSGVPNVDITTNGNSVTMRYGDVEKSPVGGKISGSTDTFLLYAMEQDAASNFEISAKAHVDAMVEDTGVSGYGQISFGAICMDRVVIDANAKETYDYVAAGAVKYSTTSTNKETNETTTSDAFLTFMRNTEDSSLSSNIKEVYNPKTGDTVDVKIKKVGNKFTVTYGDKTTTYEKEMEGSVYYGFYVTRLGQVTFSDITFNNEVVE